MHPLIDGVVMYNMDLPTPSMVWADGFPETYHALQCLLLPEESGWRWHTSQRLQQLQGSMHTLQCGGSEDV